MFSILGLIAIAACLIFSNAGAVYLAVLLMALSAITIIQGFKPKVMKFTRWSKANPRKAILLITALQLTLMGLGIMTGYNLNKLGFEFSDLTACVFTVIMVAGFCYAPLFRKNNVIIIPQELNKQRFAYLSIILSISVIMCIVGNRVGDYYPDSRIVRIIDAVDQTIFDDDISRTTFLYEKENDYQEASKLVLEEESIPQAQFVSVNNKIVPKTIDIPNRILHGKKLGKGSKVERKAYKKIRKSMRKKAAGGSCALGIFFIVLLLIPLCAGVCLTVLGISGFIGGFGVVLGIPIVGLSIWGMVEAGKMCARRYPIPD